MICKPMLDHVILLLLLIAQSLRSSNTWTSELGSEEKIQPLKKFNTLRVQRDLASPQPTQSKDGSN